MAPEPVNTAPARSGTGPAEGPQAPIRVLAQPCFVPGMAAAMQAAIFLARAGLFYSISLSKEAAGDHADSFKAIGPRW